MGYRQQGIEPGARPSPWLASNSEDAAAGGRRRAGIAPTAPCSHSSKLGDANLRPWAARDANDLLACLVHELRTPLTAILGFIELLSLSELDAQKRHWVDSLARASQHLLLLVDETLGLSRARVRGVPIRLEPVLLGPLLDEVVTLIEPLAGRRDVSVHPPAMSEGRDCVLADEQRLKQVLLNLLSNAVKYNRVGGDVRVDVHPVAGERVRIRVEDTGIGMDGESVAKLFVPFERLDAAASGIEGTGLGLALSRDLVEAMGGTIAVASTPNVGTVFSVVLPQGTMAQTDVGDPLLAGAV